MTEVKITNLTSMNIGAMRDLFTPEQAARVTIGKTVATFHMAREDAYALMSEVKQTAAAKHGMRGHPVASLNAVLRKLKPTN